MKNQSSFTCFNYQHLIYLCTKISKTELKDKIAGAWIGQMVGNIYGLPFENKFVDEPAPESDFHSVTLKI